MIQERIHHIMSNRYIILLSIVYMFFFEYCFGNDKTNELLCGPLCLLSICDYHKITTTIDEIVCESDYNAKYGTTMLGLHLAAQKLGLSSIPLKIDIHQLCRFNNPIIVFVNGNHFLIVHRCKGDKVLIQNPPSFPFLVSKEAFLKKWDGEALVFDKKLKNKMESKIAEKTAPLEGSSIHFYKTEFFAGTVIEGEKLSHIFEFTNIGSDALEVSTRSTCSCTTAILSDRKILSGGHGQIKIEYDTNGKKGHTQQGAYLYTNDPRKKIVKLTIAATVKSSVRIVPEEIWLDEIVMGEEITREIIVIDSGDSTLKVENVETPSGIKAEILSVREKPVFCVPVQLIISTEYNPGDFEKQITIRTNDKIHPEITVPISGIVLGEAKVFPPMVYFNDVKPGDEVLQESTISSTNGRELRISKIETSSPNLSTVIVPEENGKKYTLKTTFKAVESNSTVRDSLRVYAEGKNEPILKIPVYARINGENE